MQGLLDEQDIYSVAARAGIENYHLSRGCVPNKHSGSLTALENIECDNAHQVKQYEWHGINISNSSNCTCIVITVYDLALSVPRNAAFSSKVWNEPCYHCR